MGVPAGKVNANAVKKYCGILPGHDYDVFRRWRLSVGGCQGQFRLSCTGLHPVTLTIPAEDRPLCHYPSI